MQSRSHLISTIFGRTMGNKMAPRFAASPSTARDVFGLVDWTTLGVTVELTADVGIEVELPLLHRSPWQQSSVQLENKLMFPNSLHAVT